MLEFLCQKVESLIDVKSIETADRFASKGGPFKAEAHDLTPLQLAVISPHVSVQIIKTLFGKEAN